MKLRFVRRKVAGAMPVLAALLGAFLFGAPATPAAAQEPTLRIATEGAYPPWNFTRPDGGLDGFEVELAQDLCRRMQARCDIVQQDFDGMIPALTSGKFDAIMAGMSITEQRQQAIAFSRPYVALGNGIVVEKGTDLARALGPVQRLSLDEDSEATKQGIARIQAALKGKAVGVQGSTTHAAFAERYLAKVADIRLYKTTEQHDLDLAAGRLDAIIADSTALQETLGKPDFADYAIMGPGFTGGVLGTGIGVGLRKPDTALKTRFDEAIGSALADGTLKRLSEKWFKLDVTPRP
ncbi:transporter substrate-binding domain-containing protein [Roseomonas gilardii]|uniref:transporter substrate-binding domain-containing protein n=1 Tax=Roseomonas gilardii TaxID=257708 RepID=UPI00055EEF1E|nr:transporter substrate-binding domain-containing protein [Roseomonas gilardii]SUE42825.1 Lysine-arginine-ornithine-binding periplasmic protein precursor [Roseomonas gilardii subsp. rosea]